MSAAPLETKALWQRAVLVAQLFAVAPALMGGIRVRARSGPVRERWLQVLAEALPEGVPARRVPLNVSDERLLGGMDLGATLASGRPVHERGILAAADGGVVTIVSAERVDSRIAGHIAGAMDLGAVRVERDGLSLVSVSKFGLVLLDEAANDEQVVPGCLADRVAFDIDLDGLTLSDMNADVPAFDIASSHLRFAATATDDASLEAISATADALGIQSVRAPLFALTVARASAALAERDAIDADDISLAAALVLAPRATRVPSREMSDDESDGVDRSSAPEAEETQAPDDGGESESQDFSPDDLKEMAVAAAVAAIPKGLLEALGQNGRSGKGVQQHAGRAGAERRSVQSGRPLGAEARRRSGSRLDILAMLRAAAPWQELRRREHGGRQGGIIWRPDDLRSKRFKHHDATATIFVVDASGSSALHRLGEAKGAVEMLLADCYVRRDQVALIAFRGNSAELLLPPTRSLVRAKRSLAGLPGGGGTPLAAAIAEAGAVALSARRKGFTASVVFLTDGRANVARDGRLGRDAGTSDAEGAARVLRSMNLASLVIDTSPRPNGEAGQLAAALGGKYLPLPHADARMLSTAVRAAATR